MSLYEPTVLGSASVSSVLAILVMGSIVNSGAAITQSVAEFEATLANHKNYSNANATNELSINDIYPSEPKGKAAPTIPIIPIYPSEPKPNGFMEGDDGCEWLEDAVIELRYFQKQANELNTTHVISPEDSNQTDIENFSTLGDVFLQMFLNKGCKFKTNYLQMLD